MRQTVLLFGLVIASTVHADNASLHRSGWNEGKTEWLLRLAEP